MGAPYLLNIIMKNPGQKDISESTQGIVTSNRTKAEAVVLITPFFSGIFLRKCKITGFGI
jgi:hypothetical protein